MIQNIRTTKHLHLCSSRSTDRCLWSKLLYARQVMKLQSTAITAHKTRKNMSLANRVLPRILNIRKIAIHFFHAFVNEHCIVLNCLDTSLHCIKMLSRLSTIIVGAGTRVYLMLANDEWLLASSHNSRLFACHFTTRHGWTHWNCTPRWKSRSAD